MKVIISKDGAGVAVTNVAKDINIEEIVANFSSECFVIDDKTLPDYYFRSAWIIENAMITIDVGRAKNIQHSRWRAARKPLLQSFDSAFMQAIEAGDAERQKEIAALKQALRDVTKTDLPNTLEEIKATWPDILGINPFVK